MQIDVALTTNSFRSVLRFLRNDRAVAFTGACTAVDEVRNGDLVRITVEHPSLLGTKALLLVKRGRPLTKAARHLADRIGRCSRIFNPRLAAQ